MSLTHTKPPLLSGKQRGQKQKAENLSINGEKEKIVFLCYSLMATMASKCKAALGVEASLCSVKSSVLT